MPKQKIDLTDKTILVTGSPGFIGANFVMRLLKEGKAARIISLDNMNSYYDPKLKQYRLNKIGDIAELSKTEHYSIKGDISEKDLVFGIFNLFRPEIVVNLAGQAGVRYSIDHPDEYISSNITGFFNILEACRKYPVEHLVYASSSSVYGGNTKLPFSTDDNVDHPVSLYAATKKSNELMAHAYSKLYEVPCTGLRFFTVYGPAGRPDMFYFSAAEKLAAGKKIKVFNYGNMKRDFTYIDDIIEGIYRIIQGAPEKKTGDDGLPIPPYAVYNIGGGTPEDLVEFINVLSDELIKADVLPPSFNVKKHMDFVPMQPGDVPITYADSSALERDYDFKPTIDIRVGLKNFAAWYKKYTQE